MTIRSYFIFIFWRWLKKPEIGAKYRLCDHVNPIKPVTLYIPVEIKGSFIKYDFSGPNNFYNGSDIKSLRAFMAFYVKVS